MRKLREENETLALSRFLSDFSVSVVKWWDNADRFLLQTIAGVCLVHVVLILLACVGLFSSSSLPMPARKQVVVQTVRLSPVSRMEADSLVASIAPAPPTPQQRKAEQEHKPKPKAKEKKKEEKKKSEKKKEEKKSKKEAPKKAKTAPKPAPSPSKDTKPKISADTLSEVRKALNKIDHSVVQPSKSTSSSLVAVTSASTEIESGYQAQLSDRLQMSLTNPPDHGDVKVKITLDREGRIVDFAVVQTESSANSDYVKNELPRVTFPPFGNHYPGEAKHTFQLSIKISNRHSH